MTQPVRRYGADADSANDYNELGDLNAEGNEVGSIAATADADPDDDDGDDDVISDAATDSGTRDEKSQRERLDEARDQVKGILDDAEEGDLKLTDFQRYWRRIQETALHHANLAWRLDGPGRAAAAHIASIVRAGQTTSSQLSQLYASRHFGAQFEPFEPGPDIMERPGVDKLELYMRPARESGIKEQLSRLETLVNTDLQLSKVRTLYSAFDEDQKTNRRPIKMYKRVTSGEKPCALCEIAADQVYFTDDLMPIHDNCMCDVEEADASDLDEHKAAYHHIGFVQTLLNTDDQKKDIRYLADQDAPPEDYHNLVKIEQHGELGPVIVWAKQKFTGPGDLPNPLEPRPVPTTTGGGIRHEQRLADNRARVAQYRAQHFGPGARDEPRYAPGHGLGSSHIAPPPYGMPPIAKVGAPVRKKPKEKPKDIPTFNMGRVTATIGPEGRITVGEPKVTQTVPEFDFKSAPLGDVLKHMADKHADKVPPDSWNRGGWRSPRYNDEAKRNMLQAIDEMLTKYPDVKVNQFNIDGMSRGVVAVTSYARGLTGVTNAMTFSSDIMTRTPEQFRKSFKRSEDEGLYFTGASIDPYRATVYHEYGHVLDVRGRNEARKEASATMARMYVDSVGSGELKSDGLAQWMGEKDRLSGYSMQDFAVPGQISPNTGLPARMALAPAEAIAQAFDDVERRGDAASDLSHALHDLVIERSKVPYPGDDPDLRRGFAALSSPQSAVERLAQATTPELPWTPAQMAKEDNQYLSPEMRDVARKLATDVYTRGAAVEPAITAAARSSVEHSGGFMSGLDFRLKTGPSLYRKIQAEAITIANNDPNAVDAGDLKQAMNDIKDSVRYTGIMPQEGYWKSGTDLRKALESLGAKTIKDPQGIPLRGYRGRNMAFELNGIQFEMQVNTEQGVAIKDEAHQIYNNSRKLESDLKVKGIDPESDPTYQKMMTDMQEKWDAVPIMKGTPVVPTEKAAKGKDPSQILYIAKDSKYRGPTIPGGEADLDAEVMRKRARVPSSAYGMKWVPDSPNAKIVTDARAMDPAKWDQLPVESLPYGTPVNANEGTLKKSSLDKVIGGTEPFREGYVTKLWREPNGDLHVVDGHHRVAMYHALGKNMPVRILDRPTLEHLSAQDTVSDALAMPEKRGPVTRYGPGGKFDAPHPLDPNVVTGKGIGFLNHQDMVDNIIARYNDASGDKEWIRKAGEAWYPAARTWVLKMLDATGSDMDLDRAAAIVAQYSENASWTDNMARAMNYFSGMPTKAFKATDARTKAIAEADDPLSVVKGPKVNNFVRAILGADRFPDAVAVDRWAARIALGTDDKDLASKILGRTEKGQRAGYEAMADAYRDAARQLGIPPSELQAVTWVHAVPPDKTVAAFKEAGEWQF